MNGMAFDPGNRRGPMRARVGLMPKGTRLGRRAGLLGIGILFAGFNTGNNLFYLIFTILAASEIVGFYFGWWALRGLEARVSTPARARAGAPVRATIHVRNTNRAIPVPSLLWKVVTLDGDETA